MISFPAPSHAPRDRYTKYTELHMATGDALVPKSQRSACVGDGTLLHMSKAPPLERDVRRILKRTVLAELLAESADNAFIHETAAYYIQNELASDPDLIDLESHRDALAKFVSQLAGIKDGFADQPWTRFPTNLMWSGMLAKLNASASKTLMALLGLVEPRTLQTFASIATIARHAGQSERVVSRNLAALKREGLIHRFYRRIGPGKYLHYKQIKFDTIMSEHEKRHRVAPRPVGR